MGDRPTAGIDDTGPLVGAVLTGGASRRFGSDKALADFHGRPVGSVVVAALREADCDPVIALGGTAGTALGVPIVPDRRPGDGPLAALADGLTWLGRGRLVVAPCDLPLLTAAHLVPLVAAAGGGVAAVATVDGRPQPSLGVWPAAWARPARDAVRRGRRAFRHALDLGPWSAVEVPPEALADADTVAELDQLRRRIIPGAG